MWAIAGSAAFSVLALWLFTPSRLGAPLSALRAVGGGLFAVLLAAGTFNLLLYLVGYCQATDLASGASAQAPARPPESVGGRTSAIRTRTAIVMPVCHEDMGRVAAGIRQTWRSCKSRGLDQHCDWYLLCDSTEPELCSREERAVEELLPEFETVQAWGRPPGLPVAEPPAPWT